MSTEKVYLGIDLGAESGRVMAGLWNGRQIRLEELHRFPNGGVQIAGTLRWDILRLWAEIQNGLAIAGKKFGNQIVSIGVDTWALDFVLLDKHGEMLGLPYHYRDVRTRGGMEQAFSIVSRPEIFAETGLQFMEINTLYQLLALQRTNPELLAAADCFLMIPDFINWCLCGARGVEFTNGSTTQFVHPLTRNWSFDLLEKFNLPKKIFPQIVQPGTNLGLLRESVAEKTGLPRVPVIAPPTHDTAAAVAGVPTANTGQIDWAYISSGTWSLMGIESPNALLGERVLQLNLTNEGGIDGTYRVLKNIMGMWLVANCKRSFESQGKIFSYEELERLASQSAPLRAFIDPDDSRFLNPSDMPKAIRDFCGQTNQPVPESEGALVRCALESLALKYRVVLGWLEEVSGNRIEVIHIVGGGSRNKLLNQFTADACNRPVITGPVETTVLGNLLVQARASGELNSLSEMRQIIRESSELNQFDPKHSGAWDEAFARFSKASRS